MIARQILGGTVHWEQFLVYIGLELLAGALATPLFGLVSKTAANKEVKA